MGRRAIDYTGEKIGNFVVESILGERDKFGHILWQVRCGDCGTKLKVSAPRLSVRRIKCSSCGSNSARTIGRERRYVKPTPAEEKARAERIDDLRLKFIWRRTMDRCTNPTNKSYPVYGGADIHMCDEWQKFEPFREWAKKTGYDKSMSLIRVDLSKDFSPENCKWAPHIEAPVITCRNVIYNNMPLSVYCRKNGLNYLSVAQRKHRGWPIEKAVTDPLGVSKSGKTVIIEKEDGHTAQCVSIAEATNVAGVSRFKIKKCLNGDSDSVNGVKFRFAE